MKCAKRITVYAMTVDFEAQWRLCWTTMTRLNNTVQFTMGRIKFMMSYRELLSLLYKIIL